jgi:predicted acetyltransferase/quercetin dioxygenase-like cupin family protein
MPHMIAIPPGHGTHLGSSIIRVSGEDTGGALAVYETTLRAGALIEPHTHINDVWVYVLTGQTSVLVGDEIAHGGPGTFLLKPRDVVHAMWNETDEPSRIFEILTPGGAERFFLDVHALPEGDEAGFARVKEEHGLRFLPDHPRLEELRARVAGVTGAQPSVTLRAAVDGDGSTLAHLLQLYLHEIAPVAHGGWNPIGSDGRYAYPWLEQYGTDPGRAAFLIEVDGALAGFVLVNQHEVVDNWSPAHSIAEFFVLPRYRGRGVGETAARLAFDRFPGKWQVAQDTPNVAAQAFWRATVGGYTQGRFETRTLDDDRWRGPVLLFEAGAPDR